MKIIRNDIENEMQFRDLSYGDIFKHGKYIYIKTDSEAGVDLATGSLDAFDWDDPVVYIPNAQLIIE